MIIKYEDIIEAFLSKITEFELLQLSDEDRESVIEGYLKRAIAAFKNVSNHNLSPIYDDDIKDYIFELSDITEPDKDELIEIISEGMIVQWLKPYVYKQEILENALSTADFSTYSPAELLNRVRETYTNAQKNYTQMIREYSYNHGDLTRLHLW